MGGAQHHIVKLCQALNQSDVSIAIFLLIRNEPQHLLPELRQTKVAVAVSPFQRSDPRSLKWLADGLVEVKADVVHSFLWTADAIASLSKILFGGPPLICSERGDRGWDAYYSISKNLYDRVLPFRVAKLFCANSGFGGNLLARLGCSSHKIRVIHNGVDLTRINSFLPFDLRKELHWPSHSKIVGIVSRLEEYKGIDVLIHALVNIRDTSVRCVIIGDGSKRAMLEQLVSRLGISERVAFLGTQTPVEPFIKAFDVAILATRQDTEHCSNSILEYMACEKPIIVTRVGGNQELITDRISGFVVEPNNPDAMMNAINEIIANHVLAQHMAETARTKIEREFKIEVIAERFISLWRETART